MQLESRNSGLEGKLSDSLNESPDCTCWTGLKVGWCWRDGGVTPEQGSLAWYLGGETIGSRCSRRDHEHAKWSIIVPSFSLASNIVESICFKLPKINEHCTSQIQNSGDCDLGQSRSGTSVWWIMERGWRRRRDWLEFVTHTFTPVYLHSYLSYCPFSAEDTIPEERTAYSPKYCLHGDWITQQYLIPAPQLQYSNDDCPLPYQVRRAHCPEGVKIFRVHSIRLDSMFLQPSIAFSRTNHWTRR